MTTEPKFIVFDKTEGLWRSVAKDFVTAAFLVLCVYVSRGSMWWTFFTGSVALLLLYGALVDSPRRKKFTTKAALKQWVDELEDP